MAMSEIVGKMTDEDLRLYLGGLEKTAIIHRAELVKNRFDLNAIHNLNLLDNMAITAISRFLNQ
jgi:hypothetical protein